MSRLRFVVAAGVVGALAAFLLYTYSLPEYQPPADPASKTNAAPTAAEGKSPLGGPASKTGGLGPAEPRPVADRAAFTNSEQCATCHKQIYDEWKADQHSTAWTEEIFKTFTENYARAECLSCHAPVPLLDVGIDTNEPKLRESHRADGVGCLACHMKDGKSYGTLGSGAACGGILEPKLKTSQACYHCHSTHNLFKEYLASDAYKKGITCQDCHMKEVERPVAADGPKRKTRMHTFHAGGHDPEGLKKALEVDLKVEGRTLTVTVTNVGAGHGVPGEINNRQIALEISVLTTRKEIVDGKEVEMPEEVLARRPILEAPPRFMRDKIPSKQVFPGEPRVMTFELPIDHGTVETKMMYRLDKQTVLWDEAFLLGTKSLKF
ncbi:MAG: hypothetical protein L6R28_23045 [Planctomycetes bacterium]|nr:hypothetical protein [Planctomycetota bacterium]